MVIDADYTLARDIMLCFAIGDTKAVLWGFLGLDNWTQPCLDWRKKLKKIK